MDEEVEWQSHYDSLFGTFPVQVPPAVLEQLPLQSNERQQWPRLPNLPELPRLLDLLEAFISDSRNWMKKRCSEAEMGCIEEKLNGLMICLQCQKHYGCQFWRADPRRAQASIVHAYIFLKMLVAALVPPNYTSLMHANSEEKLMTEVFKLENLVNEWIQLMKPLHAFMHGAEFASEAELTEGFFNELFQFFKAMPKIQKNSMAKPPRIMEFINVCLEIQTCQQKITSGSSSRTSRRASSKSGRQNNLMKKQPNGEQNKRELPEFFRFDERVRVHTAFLKKKKLTVTSIETKEKTQSNEKSRSPSLDRSLTLFESDRLKRGTLNESPRREGSNPKVRSRILTSKTNYSEASRQRSRKKSMDGELAEQERDCKVKKKKTVALPVKVGCFSEQVNLERGGCKGWGIIREYLKKRIAERKLKKLFLL